MKYEDELKKASEQKVDWISQIMPELNDDNY